MKKFLALFLGLMMIMSVSIFAETTESVEQIYTGEPVTYDNDNIIVSGTYVVVGAGEDDEIIDEIIKVDICWNALSFEYIVDGENATWNAVNGEHHVNIDNFSNIDIQVTATFHKDANAPEEFDVQFGYYTEEDVEKWKTIKDSTLDQKNGTIALRAAPEGGCMPGFIVVNPVGSLEEDFDGQLGYITLTITKYVAPEA